MKCTLDSWRRTRSIIDRKPELILHYEL
jgi:hypothetical protein